MNARRLSFIFLLSMFLGCTVEPNRQKTAAPTLTPSPNASPDASPRTAKTEPSPQMLPGPNAIPTDTRVVVNIPAYRMDIFHDGALIKTYKVGIGYPEFPLPIGLRTADTVIFNPTWTVPDESWAAEMKNVSVGETVEAGSKNNPLGWIKIPIGQPSLIHGGKAPAKIGKFASHGCVGLTNPQVKDFALRLAQASNTDISDQSVSSYLKEKTRTREIKLKETIPVELRYETIVLEDGKLHVYKDVYSEKTNTEENLKSVLAAHGLRFEDLPQAKQTEMLNAFKTVAKKNEVVVELPQAQKGYPSPIELDSGR